MGQAASRGSTPLSCHERSRLSRQPLLTTPSQRSALLLFVVATILSCSTSVGLYDTLTSIARCHWWRWHAFHHHCNWSQRADFVARADWRRRQIVVAGTLGMECRSARLVACCSSSSSALFYGHRGHCFQSWFSGAVSWQCYFFFYITLRSASSVRGLLSLLARRWRCWILW